MLRLTKLSVKSTVSGGTTLQNRSSVGTESVWIAEGAMEKIRALSLVLGVVSEPSSWH
jgi:hypothetical protein